MCDDAGMKTLSAAFTAENRLTYSITSGNVGSAFEVAPDVGEIKVRGHLDYENGPRVCYRAMHDTFMYTLITLMQSVLS